MESVLRNGTFQSPYYSASAYFIFYQQKNRRNDSICQYTIYGKCYRHCSIIHIYAWFQNILRACGIHNCPIIRTIVVNKPINKSFPPIIILVFIISPREILIYNAAFLHKRTYCLVFVQRCAKANERFLHYSTSIFFCQEKFCNKHLFRQE